MQIIFKKKNFFILFSGAILLISCNNASKETTEATIMKDTSTPLENKIMIPTSTCYSFFNGKDTFKLKVEIFPNVVTGKLSYNFFEKDSNNGTFEGKLHGDTLFADYTFMSEGKQSSRQIIFLLKDNVATEGYRDMEEKDGKMVFKNVHGITFQKGLVFSKTECGEY